MESNRPMTDSALKWITILSLLTLPAVHAGAAQSIVTNEDIVRLTSSDVAETEILRVIREAEQVAFDLAPDVISELRLVGVSEAVIKAMQERVVLSASPQPAARQDEGAIEIVFQPADAAAAKKKPGLPLERGAYFLICRDPTHVPDHWSTKTPMAQKFGRHHLLWFKEPPLFAEDAGKGKRARRLPLPGPGRVTLAAGVHPVEAGIAVWAPDQTWIPVAVESAILEVPAGGTVRLVVSVAVHKAPAKEPVTVEIVEPAQVPDPSAGKSPAP